MLSSFTIYFSLLTILIFALFKFITGPSKPLNLPPGPRKLPLIGNLLLLATSQDPPHRLLRDLAMKYGPMMHLKLGEVNTIIVSSPEVAKEVLKTHDVNFASRPSLVATKVLAYGNTSIAFSPYSEYWRQLRKICTLELLSAKRVKSFDHIRKQECSNLCRWIASNEGSPINLTKKVSSTKYDIITHATLGKKAKEQGTFSTILKQCIVLGSGFEIADMYPSIGLLSSVSGLNTRINRVLKDFDPLMDNLIKEHQEAKNASADTQEDLVDVLLKFHDDNQEFHLNIDNIKAVLLDVFGGGTETSTTTIDWAMSEMLRNPSSMKKAQEEVRRVFDDKGYVDESQLDKLIYLKFVISETLRMHPPLPLSLPRQSSKDCEINGYHVPAKSRVLVNIWAIGRNPDYWKDAESFAPERFSDNLVGYKGTDFEFLPFGGGRRICPGMTFGLINVELPLAMMLYHFDWMLPNNMKPEELDMTEAFGVTAARKNNLNVVPTVVKPFAFRGK